MSKDNGSGRTRDEARIPGEKEIDRDTVPALLSLADMETARIEHLISVAPQDPVHKAVTLMASTNFSQLPVVSRHKTCGKVISWESIGRRRLSGGNPKTVDQAAVTARLVELRTPLLDQIETIYAHGFVLVQENDGGRLTGIVTASDLTLKFGGLVRPFRYFEEIERRLRRYADDGFTLAEIQAVARSKPENVKSAKDLTLGNYPYLFSKENWEKQSWEIDRTTWIDALKKIITLRNEMMHFSKTRLTDEEMGMVQNFASLMRDLVPDR